MTLWENVTNKMFRSGSKINLLIGINVFVFLLINFSAELELLITQVDLITPLSKDYILYTAK